MVSDGVKLMKLITCASFVALFSSDFPENPCQDRLRKLFFSRDFHENPWSSRVFHENPWRTGLRFSNLSSKREVKYRLLGVEAASCVFRTKLATVHGVSITT